MRVGLQCTRGARSFQSAESEAEGSDGAGEMGVRGGGGGGILEVLSALWCPAQRQPVPVRMSGNSAPLCALSCAGLGHCPEGVPISNWSP